MNNQFKKLFFIVALTIGLSACGGSSSEDNNGGAGGTTGSIGSTGRLPDIVKGNVVVMTFDFLSTGQTGPVTLNTDVAFTFSSSGTLFINLDNTGLDEITINTFSEVASEFIWDDPANDSKYSLSLKANGDINEINVTKISDGAFIGQFGVVVSNSGSSSTGGGSDSIVFTVDGDTKTFDSNITVVPENSGAQFAVVVESSAGGTLTFRVPNSTGAFTCNLSISGDGTFTITGASTCTGNVSSLSSLSPLTATFSGTIFDLNALANTEVSNGTVSITITP